MTDCVNGNLFPIKEDPIIEKVLRESNVKDVILCKQLYH